MSRSAFWRAVRDFLKRTTLHGFKYLASNFNCDRVFWALACCACTCCAAGLCAALWARFTHQPAVLAVRDVQDAHSYGLPLVVCPPPHVVAEMMFQPNREPTLSTVLSNVIRKIEIKAKHAELLDYWLEQNQITLAEALLKYSPECDALLVFCRWQYRRMPCQELFYKELTEWGTCCVMNQTILRNKSNQPPGSTRTKRLDLSLQCSNTSTQYGCELFTIHDGEDIAKPVRLQQGHVYRLKVAFIATVHHHDTSEVDHDGACVTDPGYSKDLCMMNCLEASCGCLYPLRLIDAQENQIMPTCTMAQISCLRYFHDNSSCNCPSSCINYETQLTLENSLMEFNEYTHDPIYVGLDKKKSIVVHLRLRLSSSKMFALLSTESWLTLLSSLGGVFNMFLGVGLFSALEFLFLLLIKLPVAVRTSPEMVRPDIH